MGSFAEEKLPELPLLPLFTGGGGGVSAFDEQQPELVAGIPLEGREEEPQHEDEGGLGNDDNALYASPQEWADCASGDGGTKSLPSLLAPSPPLSTPSPSPAPPTMTIFFPPAAADFC